MINPHQKTHLCALLQDVIYSTQKTFICIDIKAVEIDLAKFTNANSG